MDKGYKVFNPDFTCRNFKFKVGETYKHDGEIEMCSEGFHFCTKAQDCFSYYDFDSKNKVAEVKAIGKVLTHDSDSKICTDKIKILRELTWQEVLVVCNTGTNNTGFGNSGDMNSGNRNSGDRNSGNRNSGNMNSGNRNSGNRNSGDRNSGDRNSGNRNSGNMNSGYMNSGNMNSGDMNSGYMNSGYRNSGVFNTNEPKLRLFNQDSDWYYANWYSSDAFNVLENKFILTMWVYESSMTDEEKTEHPEFYCQEGYLKEYGFMDACKNMKLTKEEKNSFKNLPNFDAAIFKEITGIVIK